jgi:hypothetical protein
LKKLNVLVTTACVAGSMTLITPTVYASQNAKAGQSAASSKTTGTGYSDEQQLTRDATRLLQQVDLARQAFNSKNKQTALQHINEALSEQSRISGLVKAKNMAAIVPLYSEFDESSVLGPIEAKRNNQKPSGSSATNSVGVEDTAGQFTFIGLDLDKTKRHLEAAKTALNSSNMQAASDSLIAVDSELVMETVEADLPLVTARKNLALAEGAAQKNEYRETQTALQDACRALDRYASQASGHHAQEAKQLSQTIHSYAQNITQNHAGAASKIDGWWHQVDQWFAKSGQPS